LRFAFDDRAQAALTAYHRRMNASRLGTWCLMLVVAACGSSAEVDSKRSSASAGSASAISSGSPVAAASASSSPAAADCAELRKAVVTEAGKLGACTADSDCKVHSIGVCDFVELDCYAAHVNQGSPAGLDAAVSAFKQSCPFDKCKCGLPPKSVCKSGKCTAG
jgi:hypothetical protein